MITYQILVRRFDDGGILVLFMTSKGPRQLVCAGSGGANGCLLRSLNLLLSVFQETLRCTLSWDLVVVVHGPHVGSFFALGPRMILALMWINVVDRADHNAIFWGGITTLQLKVLCVWPCPVVSWPKALWGITLSVPSLIIYVMLPLNFGACILNLVQILSWRCDNAMLRTRRLLGSRRVRSSLGRIYHLFCSLIKAVWNTLAFHTSRNVTDRVLSMLVRHGRVIGLTSCEIICLFYQLDVRGDDGPWLSNYFLLDAGVVSADANELVILHQTFRLGVVCLALAANISRNTDRLSHLESGPAHWLHVGVLLVDYTVCSLLANHIRALVVTSPTLVFS